MPAAGAFGGATMEHFSMHNASQADNGQRVLYVLIISLVLAVGGMIFVALTGQWF
jgi:hypothetical protein